MKTSDKIDSFLRDIGKSPDKSRMLEHIRQIIREKAKSDLWFLAYHILEFRDIDTELHHDMTTKWMQRVDKQHSLWLIPRGHLKTSIWTEAGTIWRLLNKPNTRILTVNAKLENALDIVADIRTFVETREIFRWLFPEYCIDLVPKEKYRRCKWGVDRLDFPCSIYAGRKEGNIEAMGVEASLVSKHYDEMNFDDMINDINTATRQYRNKISVWKKNVLQLRHSPAISIERMIGTIWHQDDEYCRTMNAEMKYRRALKEQNKPLAPGCWIYIRRVVEPVKGNQKGLTIVGEKNVFPIWPERFSPKVIEDIRSGPLGVGSYIFGCQYMLRPVSDEAAVFKLKDIKITPFFDMPDRVVNFMAVDLAVSTKEESDYTAIVVASFDEYGEMYVRNITRRHILPNETIDLIWDLSVRYNCQRVIIETHAFQETVLKFYQEHCSKMGWNIPWVETKRAMASKFARFLGLQPKVERGEFHVEEGITGIDDLIGEMTALTRDHLPPYDDILDCLADLHSFYYRGPKEIEPLKEPNMLRFFHGDLPGINDESFTYSSRGINRLSQLTYQ